MRRLLVSLILCAGMGTTLADSAPPDVSQRIDALFAHMDTTTAPGCSVAVLQDAKVIHRRGYGMANLEYGVPNKPRTVFHVASISKQFTAAAALLLVQEGRLSLSDQVRKYLPQLHDFAPPLTVGHLIHQSSGLRDQWSVLGLSGWRYAHDLITDADVLSLAARQRELNFTPGSQFEYSNTNYTLLARIVAQVSGQSLREFTLERLFRPLDMLDSHFRDDFSEVVPNVAVGYELQQGVYKTLVTHFDTVGATSLLTTIDDLMTWEQELHSGRVLGRRFVDAMHDAGVMNDGTVSEYAFGLFLGSYRGLPTVHHSGWDAGYLAQLLRFPKQRVSIACLCNRFPGDPVALVNSVADVVLADQLAPVPASTSRRTEGGVPRLTAGSAAALQGTYLNRSSGRAYSILFQQGGLLARTPGRELALEPIGNQCFAGMDGSVQITFEEAASEASPRFTYQYARRKPQVFERVPPYTPDANRLQAYLGSYISDELDIVYRLVLADGQLQMNALKLPPQGLQPVTTDIFNGDQINVQFLRDETGAVTGFLLSDGDPARYRFARFR